MQHHSLTASGVPDMNELPEAEAVAEHRAMDGYVRTLVADERMCVRAFGTAAAKPALGLSFGLVGRRSVLRVAGGNR
jgi:hypothetical protein